MSTRFGPDVRLRTRAEFDLVQRQGRRVATRSVILLGRPNELDRDRLGIIASRKFGHAARRASAKRRLREVFRRQHPSTARTDGLTPLDIVAIPRREMLALPFATFAAEFTHALDRLRAAR